ncbi:MAG: hypothetical protein WBB45_19385 [Cyclobacteriaceae bacterium]
MMLKSYQTMARFEAAPDRIRPGTTLFEAMYELFTQIGIFWRNPPEREDLRSDLFTFMSNRMKISPVYLADYENAWEVLQEIIDEHGGNKNEAYADFFTMPVGQENISDTRIARARHMVSDEFIAFQLSVGGFKAFGAANYPGYIAGANVPGQAPPYRSKEK